MCSVLATRGVKQVGDFRHNEPLVVRLVGTKQEFQRGGATIKVGEGGVGAEQEDWEAMFEDWIPGASRLSLRYFVGNEYHECKIILPDALDDQVEVIWYRITLEELIRLFGWWLRYCAGEEKAHKHIVSLIDQHLDEIRAAHNRV